MSKLGVAAAATGVGGTGAAGTYAAYHFDVFGGGSGPSVASQVSGDVEVGTVQSSIPAAYN